MATTGGTHRPAIRGSFAAGVSAAAAAATAAGGGRLEDCARRRAGRGYVRGARRAGRPDLCSSRPVYAQMHKRVCTHPRCTRGRRRGSTSTATTSDLELRIRQRGSSAAAGAVTRLVKVKSHSGELLNEAAESMAATAAELDPCRPLDDNGTRNCETLGPGCRRRKRTADWTSAATMGWIGCTSAHSSIDSVAAPPRPGTKHTGRCTRLNEDHSRKRRILQSIAGTYPSNAVLFKWKRTSSPACLLCGSASKTLGHTQCRCSAASALKEARIWAHHTLAAMLWGRLTNLSKEWQIHREVSVAALGNNAAT